MAIHLLEGDFRKLEFRLRPDSIDLIVTDPPYGRAFLPLWSDLGKTAARVLKPGGMLVAYSGQKFLPGVMERLGEYLDYYWFGWVNHQKVYHRTDVGMYTGGKPILIYVKEPNRVLDLPRQDVVLGSGREKSHHPWEQPAAEFRQLIEAYSAPGAWILDPMVGSGSVLVAAAESGRPAVGFELDPQTYVRARARLEGKG